MDQSQQNYLRIVALVYGPGLNAVRCYFDRCFPPTSLNTQLSTVLRKRLEALKQKKVLSNAQWDILFPANGNTSSVLFDVALMTLLLLHFHISKKPICGNDMLPVDQDQTPAADLARIKYYRNIIAHSNDGAIDDARYKEAWKNLCEVVDRFGDASLKRECELLARADLNMAYKSQCEELSRNITTLKEHDAALESRQDQLASDLIKQGEISSKNEDIIKNIVTDLTSKIRSLEERMNNQNVQLDGMPERLYSQQSTIPRNIKAKIMRQLKKWVEDEEKYVIIDATVNVIDLLRKHSSLTVAGNAGCGKTALIRHLALRFMSQGYEIVPVIEPKTIVEYHDETKKQVFVLDDACGVHTVDRQKSTAWLDYSQDIQDCLLQSGALLLVSVRLSTLNSELFQDIKVLSQNVINLKEKKYALTLKNRQDIFQSYFQRGHEELGITDKSLLLHDAFPLLCRFSSRSFQTVADEKMAPLVTKSDNDLNDLERFFQTPIQVIESEIKSLRLDSPESYCLLVLCLLFNGKLPMHDLFKDSSKHEYLLKDCYGVCGVNTGTPIKTLSDIAKSLTGVYLNEVDGTLIFIHDIIMDIVSVYFGKHSPNILLKYADIEFIINRVQLKSSTAETTGYRIFIAEDHHVDFFHRCYTEIEKGNACQVFNHGQIKNEWFQKVMIEYLEKKSDKELRYIFFQVKDKVGDRHRKLRLKVIDIWAQLLDRKPAKIDCHSFLDLIVNNAFQWLLGKGLFDIIMLLERRLCSDVYKEMSKDSSCTFIAILGGNVKTYSWIRKAQKRRIWRYVTGMLFENKYLIQDFQWATLTGQTNIVEFLLNYEICQTCINESITSYDIVHIVTKLIGLSVYTTRMMLFLTKCLFKLNLKWYCLKFNLENIITSMERSCTIFYTEDERFNKLIYKKFKSDIEPIISKQYERRVESQCSEFPLPETIDEDQFGFMEVRKTYLAYAIILGHESVVDLLLRKGANPNEISIPSNTIAKSFTALPVVYASMNGRLGIVQNLLTNGAKIESTGPEGSTLLIYAASVGHYDLAKFLLDKHVAINAKNMFQNTALFLASKKGHTNIVHLLLENGANPNIVCYKSSTPLIEASSAGHIEIVEGLLSLYASVNALDKHVDINATDMFQNTALFYASQKGHTNIVHLLLANGAVPNTVCYKSSTPLIEAASAGYIEIVEGLLSLNAKVNACDNKNMTALTKAAKNGHYTIVERMIENQADLNIRTYKDETALMIACRKGHFNVVSVLIQHLNGYIRNRHTIQDNEFSTLENENRIAFKQLPYAFCSLSITEINQGFLIAYHHKHINIIKLLLDNSATVNFLLNNDENVIKQFRTSLTFLNDSILNGDSEIVNILLKDGAQVQKRANSCIPPLMLASYKGHIDIVKILLKHGSNINSTSEFMPINLTSVEKVWVENNRSPPKFDKNIENPDKNGTALICAIQTDNLELVEALLKERSINVNSQTVMGRTALMIACGASQDKIVKSLLHYNAEVNIRSKLGLTALDIAQTKRFFYGNIVRSLQQKGAIHSPEWHHIPPGRPLNGNNVLDIIWDVLLIIFITCILYTIGLLPAADPESTTEFINKLKINLSENN